MGVDATGLATRAATPEVSRKARELKTGDQRLLVGVDRLDYSKGIPRRLLAFERLLETHPEWIERVRLVQVAVPSRDNVGAYKRFRREFDRLVGRINGRFATATWTPIHYLYRSIPEDQLLALYRAADVMLVTPVRDGMNLVAKEFVASRVDDDGVLVLSEFAGAADELTDAILVNPYDVCGLAESMHGALSMPEAARRSRMRAMRTLVRERDVHRWTSSFLETLGAVSARA
jgi:trehalose 6-phosphate synthase/phosphatase